MRLATVPIEEGADAGGPVSDVCEPAAAAAPEPLPGGPGFLFVATQGGRPPDDVGLRDLAAVVRRRRAALRRWADGDPLATICAEFGCSRASLFRWRTRFERDGLEGLLDRPRVGRRSDLPTTIERLILTVRLLTYWNSRRIAAEFRRREVWPLSHGQVDRILARHGTHRPSYVRTPGPRYERAAANELWHIDLKGPFYLLGATGRARTCHFVALVDDHSRFLLGIRAVPTKEAIWILALLEEAIELCGVPHELMTDNGTPFVAISPDDAQPLPAQPRRARDPPHPDPDRHALDESIREFPTCWSHAATTCEAREAADRWPPRCRSFSRGDGRTVAATGQVPARGVTTLVFAPDLIRSP